MVSAGQNTESGHDGLESRFDKGFGQLQVGGPYAGVEFHHSRPLPSRVSFFYPVANSIDLSTDYWRRDESMPFSVTLTVDGTSTSIGDTPYPYLATPSRVVFENDTASFGARLDYRFGASLPVVVLELTITNHATESNEFEVTTRMSPTLRTSHAYDFKTPTASGYLDDGSVFRADFDDMAADSVTLFVLNADATPVRPGTDGDKADSTDGHDARFSYRANLDPGEKLVITQVIGSCRRSEFHEVTQHAREDWREDVETYESRVADYALHEHAFRIDDGELVRTERWSKALLAADMHYLDGKVVPMPTPAQYNFFFTHDLLLTDLGAVHFDTARVAKDLRYLASLAYPDSLLPHAYYWRNDEYVTEYAGSDNWNHLWFILLSSSYLKHSGDQETIRSLIPMLRNSLRLMLQNERDGLMYSERPDWWDIGHVYGARAYLTTLMIRALRSYVYLSLELGYDDGLGRYLDLADKMRGQLVEKLWDEDAGYLLNMLDSTTVDRHYYSGSLLAAAFDLLDPEMENRLLESARDVLLDEQIGIRNAMPPDFLDHIDRYRFNGPEVGAPYQYMNGGIWPQGIAWYAMGMLAADRKDDARDILKRFLTLDGIERSPSGQPALFEYRNADWSAPGYGRIDKTAFLWAGGWYLHVLYQLAGVRENEWNLWFDPNLPSGFDNVEYDLVMHGGRSRVAWSGDGPFFRRLAADGRRVYSAVATAPATQITLERGLPDDPYLARATGIVDSVEYEASAERLNVHVRGLRGQSLEVVVASPTPPRFVFVNGHEVADQADIGFVRGAYVTSLTWTLDRAITAFGFGF